MSSQLKEIATELANETITCMLSVACLRSRLIVVRLQNVAIFGICTCLFVFIFILVDVIGYQDVYLVTHSLLQILYLVCSICLLISPIYLSIIVYLHVFYIK